MTAGDNIYPRRGALGSHKIVINKFFFDLCKLLLEQVLALAMEIPLASETLG